MTRTAAGRRRLPRSVVAALTAACAVATGSVTTAGASATAPIVRTEGGWVRGVSAGGVDAFRGLPYAAPPTGPLRWRPPHPAAPWSGVRDASQFAPSCPQSPIGNASFPPGPMAEDCLYLNVVRPSGPGRSRRPVLVWIHGGGLTQDAARNYVPTKLAAAGLVVVTINYRLAALGFLAHPALASRPGGPSGNYGLMDQQAALRWVQRNIARFGGNPGNVTIAGQSAGGLSVLAHLVSRGSRGLFQRAIVQSGAFALQQRSLADAEAAGEQFATSVGCADQTAACLRNVPVANLVDNFGVEIPGVVDGSVLTQTIGTALAHGQFTRVPVLQGITHDEERLFLDGLGLVVANGTFVLATGVTDANYQEKIGEVLGVPAARAAAIAVEYPLDAFSSADVAFSTLVSDANFACPALDVDRLTSGRVPTFAYQFNDDSAPVVVAPPGQFPVVATHGSELPYLFDQPNALFPPTLDPVQEALANTMRTAWARFAATGNPSSAGLTWPAFSDGAQVISLATPTTVVPDSGAVHHCGFWAAG
jgi:para-nitrobenzyl esterase